MAKKKKSKAQAAAARKEMTIEDKRRAQAKERGQLIRASAQAAQKKAAKSSGFRLLVPILVVGTIIVAALAFTIVPGMVMGK